MTPWNPFEEEKPLLHEIQIRGTTLQKGSRVLLAPQSLQRAGSGSDIMDLALAGKAATVDGIEQDFEGRVFLAVTVDDDPGKDFGEQLKVAHRFFFRPDEVEPIGV
jgi:hypothetical protein